MAADSVMAVPFVRAAAPLTKATRTAAAVMQVNVFIPAEFPSMVKRS